MKVGVGKVRLRLPENDSLKGKRRFLKSLTDKVGNRFNVAVAEVEDQDVWRMVTLGVSCVGNDASHVNEMLSRVVHYVDQSRIDAEFLDYEIEIMDAL